MTIKGMEKESDDGCAKSVCVVVGKGNEQRCGALGLENLS